MADINSTTDETSNNAMRFLDEAGFELLISFIEKWIQSVKVVDESGQISKEELRNIIKDIIDEHPEIYKGPPGDPGKDGETPYAGENGNWWIGDVDTGCPVTIKGEDGESIIGIPGKDGVSPTIEVVVDKEDEYVLKITTADGSFLTPNLVKVSTIVLTNEQSELLDQLNQMADAINKEEIT